MPMFALAILAVIAAAIAGLLVKFALDSSNSDKEITWTEYAIGLAAISVLLVPLSLYGGWKMAQANNLGFYEYRNGWELKALTKVYRCTRDGPCRYEYDCDPYWVTVSYDCSYYTGSGENRRRVHKTCTRREKRYHSCPYVDQETTYTVQTTLGDYTISEHRLPDNPQAHRWRTGVNVPDYVISRAGTGIPPFWERVQERVSSGEPGPVTTRARYDNFILASERTILQQHSGAIEKYLAKGLLPALTTDVHDFYHARKAYFVGFNPGNDYGWQKSLSYLNAGIGTELEGDLHLVIVKNDEVSANPDEYLLALKAYWQNPKFFQKNAISKNSIIVLVGTSDGNSVSWARAITGMPLGNEHMTATIRESLSGSPLTPESLIGKIQGKFVFRMSENNLRHQTAELVHGKGMLNRIFWGLDDPSSKFQRVRMRGFEYLKSEIELTRKQKIWIAIGAFLASMLAWIAAILVGERAWPYAPRWRRTYR